MGYADSFALDRVVLLVAVLAVTMLRKGALQSAERRIKSGMKQLQGGRHEPEGRH
jgi:hypothetical protein